MKSSTRPLADPRLTAVLTDLLAEEQLPPVDRWFSALARKEHWPPAVQKRLWDGLRRALARAYGLLPSAATPEQTSWGGFRVAMRGRAAEWALRAELPAAAAPTPVMAGIPGWLVPRWERRAALSGWSAEEKAAFLALQDQPAPVWVRYRPGSEGEACRRTLTTAGTVVEGDVAGFDRLAGGVGLESTDAWKKGLVEIQDAASQLSLRRLEVKSGMRVWDVCAGAGGKTLLAAGELRGKGALVATEVSDHKLRSLKDRVRRSGWQNIRSLAWDGDRTPDFGPEVNVRGGFDRVVVDAPCSASGTWRRDPESRFRLTPRVLRELAVHQSRLLRRGWDALRTGGRLAYITCSWLPEENEEIVEAFLEETGPAAVEIHRELLGLPKFDANTLFVSVLEKR